MGDKVGSSTNAPAPQQSSSVNPFSTAPVPKSKVEKTENPKSEKGSREHATQMKEHKKLEGSIRQSEVNGALKAKSGEKSSKALNKGPSDAEIRELKYSDNYFTDSDQLKAPPGVKPLPKPEGKRIDKGEPKEEKHLERSKGVGTLVSLSKGNPDRPMTVTVHGISASPAMVDPLSKRASKAGDAVKTFAYDDTGRRLTDSSKDLANNLQKWMKENPGRPLRIDAHSMGGRVALAALDSLESKGLLKGRKVELNLIASPINGTLSGYAGAVPGNTPVAGVLLSKIPYVNPGIDMTPTSDFQDKLDKIKFSDNVKVRVFVAGKDDVVNHNSSFDAMCKQLKAERVTLPTATHDSAVDEAAVWLTQHDRKVK